jgi:WD40 repeat protein
MKKKFSGMFAVLALLTAFLFFSFRDKSDSGTFTKKDFARPVDLKGSILQVDSMIMKPVNINVVDNLMFLTNSRTDYIFEVYDLNTNRMINRCLKFGQGPDEMIRPTIVNITKDSLWIFDSQTWLFNYRTKDFISGSKPEYIRKIKLGNHSKATVLPDGRIIASPAASMEKKFDYYNLDAKLLESKGEYTDDKLSKMEKMMSYRFGYATGLNNRIFACYTYMDIIEIYDLSTGDLIKRRFGPNKFKAKPAMKSVSKDGVTIFSQAEPTLCYHVAPVRAGNEVFVMYIGGPYDEQTRGKCNRMLVFDFEGNPLRIYNLDIPLLFFDVDAEKRIIYGVTDMPDLDLPNAQSDFNIIKYEY